MRKLNLIMNYELRILNYRGWHIIVRGNRLNRVWCFIVKGNRLKRLELRILNWFELNRIKDFELNCKRK